MTLAKKHERRHPHSSVSHTAVMSVSLSFADLNPTCCAVSTMRQRPCCLACAWDKRVHQSNLRPSPDEGGLLDGFWALIG